MTGSYQTFITHGNIKFENCLPFGELNSIKNYSKTIDFHHLILATVDTTNEIWIGWNMLHLQEFDSRTCAN